MSHLVALRTFVEAYRAGSVSKAAAQLGLSQPAASAHLKQLESALGKALFVRVARGLQPTAAAHDLAALVGAPLDAVESGLATAKARSLAVVGTVHLAAPAEFLSERCGPALNALMAHGLRLRVHVGNRERILQLLTRGEVDLALTASTPRDRALGQQQIASEQFQLVAAPALARRLGGRQAQAEELRRLPLIAYDEDLPLVREYCRTTLRMEPDMVPAAVLPELRGVRALVMAGAGWSVLPNYLCADALARGALVEIGPPGPNNPLVLVWQKSALRHPRVSFVKDALLAWSQW